MSINFNRSKANKCKTNRELKYKLYWLDPYWDEGIVFKKGHMPHKYREFKTWKHNRKTQYK